MPAKNFEKTSLLIGRFQPPHKGHEALISSLLKRRKKLIIAIGSSRKKRKKENPFSAKERLFLLKKLFAQKKGKGKIKFIFLPDNPSNKKWVQRFCKKFPKEKYIIYSANPLVQKLLKSHEFGKAPLLRRKSWQGKAIRKKIIEKKPYFSSIPAILRKWMKNKGEKIIRNCQSQPLPKGRK